MVLKSHPSYDIFGGHADFGGDSSAVRDQLKNVQQIQATYRAFAAILADGCVVTYTSVTRAGV